MEKIAVTAQVREKAGKGVARSLRRNKMVPAVLYSHGKSMPIAMGSKDMTKVLNTEGGEHALLTLTLDGAKDAKERMALIKDYQVDPIKGDLIHVDLMEVAMDEKVRVPIAVHVVGSAAGVKEGGILQLALRELEIECLPSQIPDSIEVNVSALKVNESLHVRDVAMPEGVRILSEPEATVVTIQPPISDAKLEAMLQAAPAAETGEPELVKKPKGEEAAAAAPAAEAGKEAAKKPEAKEAKKEAAPKK
jgi:large subunit ribosomal protein L25